MLKGYASSDRKEALLELAQGTFERWHQKLVSSTCVGHAPWELAIFPPYGTLASGTGGSDGVVVRPGPYLCLEELLEVERMHPHSQVAWDVRTYLAMGPGAYSETIYANRRDLLTPHFEGEFAADLSILATAGVTYAIYYNNHLEKQQFVRKRLRGLAEVFQQEASLAPASKWFEGTRARFLANTIGSPEKELIHFREVTLEYLKHTENSAADCIKKARRVLNELGENILIKDLSARPVELDADSDVSSSWESTIDSDESIASSEELEKGEVAQS